MPYVQDKEAIHLLPYLQNEFELSKPPLNGIPRKTYSNPEQQHKTLENLQQP